MEDRNGSFFWVGETNEQNLSPVRHRKKSKPKKLEFVGWGSRSLIEFLQSIGMDTGKQLSQYDVTAIINEYVHTCNLFNPMKKKRVVCDDRLRVLFGKNSVPRNKIHELLNPHFAENNDSSEDDEMYNSEGYEDVNITYKKHKVLSSENQVSSQKNKSLLSCFAAIIPENLKLLYLKRSLVQELVKDPESFDGKLLGSYIRIKSDPMDFSQKNSHQLHPVTGVKNVPGTSGVHEVLLEVPNMVKDIPIRMLSDDNFSKEEVEDLCQRVKDGLLKRPTIVEVEQKARILHEDITKHWLPRELAHLQNLIDRANEKGWRKELFEYLEKKKRLETPSEQTKLLTEVPTVTADALEPEDTPQEQVVDIEQPNTSPISVHASVAAEDKLVVVDGVDEGNAELIKNSGSGEYLTGFQWEEAVQMPKKRSFSQTIDFSKINNSGSGEHLTGFQWVGDVPKTHSLGQTVDLSKPKKAGSREHLTGFQWVEARPKTNSVGQAVDLSKMSNVIDLCDDVEETYDEQVVGEKPHEQDDEHEFSQQKWFYRDPQGETQGPFSKMDLNRWRDLGYFTADFKVWKKGQTPECAVLLTDILYSNHST